MSSTSPASHPSEAISEQPFAPLISDYGNVSALLLSWDDLEPAFAFDAECNGLAAVLGNLYNYDVTISKIQLLDTRKQLRPILDKFEALVQPGDLAIVYYTGHGHATLSDGLLLHPSDKYVLALTFKQLLKYVLTRKEAFQESGLAWTYIDQRIERMRCDTFVVVDACYSGSAVRSLSTKPTQYRKEYMFSCNYLESTSGSIKSRTVSRILTAMLKTYGEFHQPIPVAHLYRDICRNIIEVSMTSSEMYHIDTKVTAKPYTKQVRNRKQRQPEEDYLKTPIHVFAGTNLNVSSIVLQPLKSKLSATAKRRVVNDDGDEDEDDDDKSITSSTATQHGSVNGVETTQQDRQSMVQEPQEAVGANGNKISEFAVISNGTNSSSTQTCRAPR